MALSPTVEALRLEAMIARTETKAERLRYALEEAELTLAALRLRLVTQPPAPVELESAPAELKTCAGPCGRALPLEAFYRVHKGQEARQSRCKRCDNANRAKGDGSGGGRAVPIPKAAPSAHRCDHGFIPGLCSIQACPNAPKGRTR